MVEAAFVVIRVCAAMIAASSHPFRFYNSFSPLSLLHSSFSSFLCFIYFSLCFDFFFYYALTSFFLFFDFFFIMLFSLLSFPVLVRPPLPYFNNFKFILVLFVVLLCSL